MRNPFSNSPGDTFVRSSLAPRGRSGHGRRKALTLSALGLVAGLVSVAALIFSSWQPGVTNASKTTNTTAHATVTITTSGASITTVATNQPATAVTSSDGLPPFPAAGWRIGGPIAATNIAFAPSDVSRGYACGQTTASNAMTVSFTTNGGGSWSAPLAAITGATCVISVDPTDSGDVAVVTSPCAVGCPAPFPGWSLFRSRDGGQTWTSPTLPTEPDGTTPTYGSTVAWVGSTLVATIFTRSAQYRQIAASVKGGPFGWIDSSATYSDIYPDQQFQLFGAPNALFINGSGPKCTNVGSLCALTISSDVGATWQYYFPAVQQMPVAIVAVSADGATLIGIMLASSNTSQATPPAISTDGGHTWRALPALPNNLDISTGLIAPNGTIVVNAASVAAAGYYQPIYALRKGASTWTLLADSTAGVTLTALETDGGGHITAIWGGRGNNAATGGTPLAGLEYLPYTSA